MKRKRCKHMGYLLLFFLRVRNIPLFMVLLFLGTLGTGLFNMIIWAFITDIIDYQEIATGRREDGTVYAVYSFARKVGQALAGGLGGFVLTAIRQEGKDTLAKTLGIDGKIQAIMALGIPAFKYPKYTDRKEIVKNYIE